MRQPVTSSSGCAKGNPIDEDELSKLFPIKNECDVLNKCAIYFSKFETTKHIHYGKCKADRKNDVV